MSATSCSENKAIMRRRTHSKRRRGAEVRSAAVLLGAVVMVLTMSADAQPSVAPITPEPTLVPTKAPTLAPTLAPTPIPTASPTAQPTPVPTVMPTPPPSSAPTPSPTASPTPVPTASPTPGPTSSPTTSPSTTPSLMPSSPPTVTGSTVPSAFPSLAPSIFPTITFQPSSSPSDVPSTSPSVTASDVPTTVPSARPSFFPTPVPTPAPTLELQAALIKTSVIFDNANTFNGATEISFQTQSARHILNVISQEADAELFDLQVGTNILDQTNFAPGVDPLAGDLETQTRRRLQDNGALEVLFDTSVTFRSFTTDLDVPALVGNAFDSEEDKEIYIASLKSTGDPAYGGINTVLKTEINNVEVEVSNEAGSGLGETLFVIIGCVAGGLALCLLIALLYVRQRSKRSRRAKKFAKRKKEVEAVGRLQTDIFVEPQDEISTLGDPMYAPGAMHMGTALERDETVSPSILSGDYDYSKAYGAAALTQSVEKSNPNLFERNNSSTSAGEPSSADLSALASNIMDNSLFSDDSSFEQQFNDLEERIEVIAPAGKLGMVIDTPSGGVPVVHAIKDTSVLADRVRVGDRLVLVDDEDTTRMTAMQVSKLISQKADHPSRILVFVRTRARSSSIGD